MTKDIESILGSGKQTRSLRTLPNDTPPKVDRVNMKGTVGSRDDLKMTSITELMECQFGLVEVKELDVELFSKGSGNLWRGAQTLQLILGWKW